MLAVNKVYVSIEPIILSTELSVISPDEVCKVFSCISSKQMQICTYYTISRLFRQTRSFFIADTAVIYTGGQRVLHYGFVVMGQDITGHHPRLESHVPTT